MCASDSHSVRVCVCECVLFANKTAVCETFGAQCATIRKTKTEQRIKHKTKDKTKAAQDGKEQQEEEADEAEAEAEAMGKEPLTAIYHITIRQRLLPSEPIAAN